MFAQTRLFSFACRLSRRQPRRQPPAPLALAAFALLCTGVVKADNPSHDKAAAILDKLIEVTGGRAAHERIENRVSKKRVIDVEMGFEDRLVDYSAKPHNRYVEIESDAMGSVLQGTYDQVAWYWSEQIGTMLEEGESLAAALNAAAFDRMLNWRNYFKEVEYAGVESVDGIDCHKIVLTPNNGEPETCFFSKDSNLVIKIKKTRLSSNMPSLPVEVTLSDYREVDGILLPYRAIQSSKQCGSTRVMEFVTESIEHNVDLPSDRFDPPASVQAAVLAAKTGTAVKSMLFGDDKKAPAPPRAPCGTKSAKSVEQKSESSRKPCGGG